MTLMKVWNLKETINSKVCISTCVWRLILLRAISIIRLRFYEIKLGLLILLLSLVSHITVLKLENAATFCSWCMWLDKTILMKIWGLIISNFGPRSHNLGSKICPKFERHKKVEFQNLWNVIMLYIIWSEIFCWIIIEKKV